MDIKKINGAKQLADALIKKKTVEDMLDPYSASPDGGNKLRVPLLVLLSGKLRFLEDYQKSIIRVQHERG